MTLLEKQYRISLSQIPQLFHNRIVTFYTIEILNEP